MINQILSGIRWLAPILMLVILTNPVGAELRLGKIFGDRMVLQRDQPVQIWGWTGSRQPVSVRFADQALSTKADQNGAWIVELKPMGAASSGRDLMVSGSQQEVVLRDVVVGDVWHASGQSNMAMTLASVASRLPAAKQHLVVASFPSLRFRRIAEAAASQPLADFRSSGQWVICSPQTASRFSAVGFYFARRLSADLGVPIGIVDSSRGGTPIEPYLPRSAFASHPTLRRELELGDQSDLVGLRQLSGGVRARDENWLPARLFHSRIAPIQRFSVRGVIWYQGESNSGKGEDPRDYQHKMRGLISGWRNAFNDDLLPFYFVQLPGSGAGPNWPYLREQQRQVARLPHAGMVVTIDLLDEDIHPANKVDVGERLALMALSKAYKQPIASSGPLFDRVEFLDDRAIVHFSHSESGLMIARKDGLSPPQEQVDGQLAHFELADEKGRWSPAVAIIRDKTVEVQCDGLTKPLAVRYAYEINPLTCKLYNRAGLPASPFCSDLAMLDGAPAPFVD
ncbi:MAG: sialate O-acetylesterase [Pirellulaceae bacterium]|nr:sialate O-acetylesterase [Pirellulaceae bacterium]